MIYDYTGARPLGLGASGIHPGLPWAVRSTSNITLAPGTTFLLCSRFLTTVTLAALREEAMPEPDESQRLRAADQPVRIYIAPREAFEFGQRLGNDDDFRARLEQNPRAVLAEYHIFLAPEHLPETVRLPSKEEVRGILNKAMLGGDFQIAEVAAAWPWLVWIVFVAEARERTISG
jgi:hypothetical protein